MRLGSSATQQVAAAARSRRLPVRLATPAATPPPRPTRARRARLGKNAHVAEGTQVPLDAAAADVQQVRDLTDRPALAVQLADRIDRPSPCSLRTRARRRRSTGPGRSRRSLSRLLGVPWRGRSGRAVPVGLGGHARPRRPAVDAERHLDHHVAAIDLHEQPASRQRPDVERAVTGGDPAQLVGLGRCAPHRDRRARPRRR
jgi:hypothetical protein